VFSYLLEGHEEDRGTDFSQRYAVKAKHATGEVKMFKKPCLVEE